MPDCFASPRMEEMLQAILIAHRSSTCSSFELLFLVLQNSREDMNLSSYLPCSSVCQWQLCTRTDTHSYTSGACVGAPRSGGVFTILSLSLMKSRNFVNFHARFHSFAQPSFPSSRFPPRQEKRNQTKGQVFQCGGRTHMSLCSWPFPSPLFAPEPKSVRG